jgi:hypothetical protein
VQVVNGNRHDEQPPQKRHQPRKKPIGASPSLYTPNGHVTETSTPKIDIVG